MDEVKRIDRKLVYQGSILGMHKDTIQFPDGSTAEWDFLAHKGAAAVVPVREDGKILMVRQFRNAIDRYSLEIPAGAKNTKEEAGIECAARELEEETGYASTNLIPLVRLVTAIAFCNETIDIFTARDLVKTQQHLDEGEYLNVEAYDLSELIEMIYSGVIQDSKTVAALMAYKAKYEK